MDNFKQYLDSLTTAWKNNSPTARVGIVLLAILCVIAVGGVGYWSTLPSYVVLASQMEPGNMDKVIDALDQAGVTYSLSGAGGNLLVDKRDYARASQIARRLGVSDESEMGNMGLGSTFGSPAERRNMMRIRKQENIEAMIEKLAAVSEADVNLSIPERSPFERKSTKPSASVLLTLHSGVQLGQDAALSIARTVAFAVEDLQPESVQITDKDGRSYSIPDAGTHQINSQVEYVTEAERKLARKAEDQLFHFVGVGNASVEVSLNMTFKNGETTITTYDPEGKVAESENLQTEETTNASPPAVGPAGVASNVAGPAASGGSKSQIEKKETIESKYLVPKTTQTESNTTPERNYMTVSVVVNSDADVAKQEDGTATAGLDKKVEEIVKNAIGFKDASDAITVAFLPFPKLDADVTAAAPFDWTQIIKIVESSSLAIAALLALVLGFMMMKRIQPKPIDAPSQSVQVDRGRQDSVNRLSELVQSNPEVFSQIVRSWSGADVSDAAKKEAA